MFGYSGSIDITSDLGKYKYTFIVNAINEWGLGAVCTINNGMIIVCTNGACTVNVRVCFMSQN